MINGTVLDKLLDALSDELCRLDQQAGFLLKEKSTLTTEILIERHEKDFGLPNDYIEIESTLAARRNTLNALKNAIGRLDKQYYIELAADLGLTIGIVEFHPCICGVCECGNNNVGNQLIYFYWGAIVYYHHSMVTLADPYTIPNLSNLINMFDEYKPAHTEVLWGFYGPPFNNAFGFSFDSQPGNADKDTWDGAFAYDEFSKDFNLDYGYRLPCYVGGPFRKAFNNSFDRYRYIDVSGYFGAAFDSNFSKAFDVFTVI